MNYSSHLGCQESQCLASLTMLGCLLVLKRIYIVFLYFLYFIVTQHNPNYVICDLLYAHNMTPLSLHFASCSITTLGNNTLNISSSIRLQSLPTVPYIQYLLFFVGYWFLIVL